MMRGIIGLKRDNRGGAGMNFVVALALVAMPFFNPAKTVSMLKGAQSSWEYIWSIDGMRGA